MLGNAFLASLTRTAFAVQQLFAAGEPGGHFEVYDPNTLLARRNRLDYSEDFSNSAWEKNGATASYDSGENAYLIVPSTENVLHYIRQTKNLPGVPNTYTMRLKAAGYRWVIFGQASNYGVYFDVQDGVVGSIFGVGATASIVPVDGMPGFFDCTATLPSPTNSNFFLFIAEANADISFAGDGVKGVYVAHAQIEWGVTERSPYQKVTDWNTEFIAAVGAENIFMWQDADGTVPVTKVEDPVGRWMPRHGTMGAATQSTGARRPVLSARVNLLTKSEQFDEWTKGNTTVTANAIAGPAGFKGAADLIIPDATSSAVHRVYQSVVTAATGYVASLRVKPSGYTCLRITTFDVGTGEATFDLTGAGSVTASTGVTSATIEALSDGWYLVQLAFNQPDTTGGFQIFVFPSASSTSAYSGNGSSGVYVIGADLRTSDDAALDQPPYQRVNTATDYDSEGFIHYLKFDGSDDCLQTAAVDFTGVDNVALWVGHTKLSDAAVGMVCELTASTSANAGGFYMAAPASATTANYGWALSGGSSGAVSFVSEATLPASLGRVAAVRYDASVAGSLSTQIVPRLNGQVVALGSTSGTNTAGNLANAVFNIGRRNNASLPFNGRVTSVTARGTTTATSESFIREMEQYAADLAGRSFVSA